MTAMTAVEIATAAYEDAGKLAEGQSLTTAQQTRALKRLVDIINLEATQGLKLWLEQEYSITLAQGTRTYNVTTAAGRPLQVKQGYFLASDGTTKTPLTAMSRDEYVRLAQLTTQGAVSQYYVDKQYNQFQVALWNVPDATAATGTVKLILRVHATVPATINDTLLFPDEWASFLRWELAEELSTGAPQAIIDRCTRNSATYRELLDSFDVEDAATFFQMDTRWLPPPSFR